MRKPEGLSGGSGLGSSAGGGSSGAGGGGRETPRERIERLVREGRIMQEAVDEAERVWHERLRDGVRMPNRETVQITLDDLYHAIVDPRILRHPERIESAITHIYEIRASYGRRREAYSKWFEGEAQELAVVILEAENRLWSVHLIDEDRLKRYTRKAGEVLWTQSEQQ